MLTLITVGKLKESYYIDACGEYAKRLGAFCRLEVIELAEERLGENPSAAELEAALNREAEQIEKKLLKDGTLVCLCVEGGQMDSEAFAGLLTRTENSGRPRLSFVIGGSFGLAQKLKDRADLRLSMSKMTFPHHLARVMLLEQVYRGFQIKEGSRYHK